MQINRLFEIIYELIDNKIMTAKELSQKFEVSTRTIYRDIEILSSAGVPIYMTRGKGGGISLLQNYILDKTVLTEDEKADIVSSLKAMKAFNNADSDAARKLESLLGEKESDWIEIDFSTWRNAKEEKKLFNEIKSAILKKKSVTFEYSSAKGENSKRKVYPLKLGFKGQAWYLYAYCLSRMENRFFKLSRINDFTVLDESFDMNAPKNIFFEDETYDGKSVKLKLKLKEDIAYAAYDFFEKIEKLESGGLMVEVTYPLGGWLMQFILSFGDKAEIISPDFIRDEYVSLIDKIKLIYED